jgi:hypothetical protein
VIEPLKKNKKHYIVLTPLPLNSFSCKIAEIIHRCWVVSCMYCLKPRGNNKVFPVTATNKVRTEGLIFWYQSNTYISETTTTPSAAAAAAD